MSATLEALLRHPRLWRAGQGGRKTAAAGVPSGNAELDGWLPGGGWPRSALTELLCETQALGGLELLVPLLAACTARRERVALVAPPFTPYAPALHARGVDLRELLVVRPRLPAEGFWAAEQMLRAGLFPALLLWAPAGLSSRVLRRLQLAAEQGESCGFVFRPWQGGTTSEQAASPAALRLRFTACGERAKAAAHESSRPRLLLQLLKCRGRPPETPLVL